MARQAKTDRGRTRARRTINEKLAVTHLRESIDREELVIVVGTGISIALTKGKSPILSWAGLIEDGYREGIKRGRLTQEQAGHWKAQLNSSDMDDRLAAAEFMTRKLGAPEGELYGRWLENTFNTVKPQNEEMTIALRAIQSTGTPMCTLNYDTLLEEVTALPTINHDETAKVTGWMRRTTKGIFHLHGCWQSASTCILGIRDYETTVGNEIRDLIQRSLGTFKRLLFIGCGETFADPNFAALIGWLRTQLKTAAPQHYALVTSDQVRRRQSDVSWQGFVDPISYGDSHADLAPFLADLFRSDQSTSRKNRQATPVASSQEARHAAVIADYCSYLIRDCGQMTIGHLEECARQ